MNLAAILGFCLLALGIATAPIVGFAAPGAELSAELYALKSPAALAQSQQSGSPSAPPTAPSQSQNSAQTSSSGQSPNPAAKPQVPSERRKHPKKTIYPDCANAPAALNPVANSLNLAKPTSAAQTDAGSTGDSSAQSSSTNTGPGNATSPSGTSKASSAPLKPCPPPKKIVRDGGSNEPDIQLIGGTAAQHEASERSTEQVSAATEENLKKIAGRQLSSSEQETVNQIKQFMEQSRQAVAAGDSDRGYNLAMKARLLSDELVKP